jgi:hypothetical protein
MLNMMHASRKNQTVSAYKILNSPYDWNWYPLAKLGCKAVVYEDGNTQGSWASHGVDGSDLGPSHNHYRCNIYYIPETRTYQILGLIKLFMQHCQLPDMTPDQHLRALTIELTNCSALASSTPRGKCLLCMLADRIAQMLPPPPTAEEQRVSNNLRHEAEQWVIDDTPIIHIPCLTNAPCIMESYNPTAKRALKQTLCLHQQVTWNNNFCARS